MSEDEEENFCYFGKPLDPYDDDAFPKKRPITIEEQIATDSQGRRRFHGAFTGGFSAGFFNTVGSLEGWTPSEFKSTRQEKAKNIIQKPRDFMDQEDLEQYGIAPQTIRATKDYSTSKKRRKQVFSEGPIPGVPVLETLLTSGNETIGYLLLKKIGIKDKIKNQEVNFDTRVYGCQIPNEFRIPKKIENSQYKIPEIYITNLAKPKSNTFGLAYEGLDRSHINLFTTTNVTVTDSKNKKFAISGQAFGVGAFEEDDDDIYMKDNMSNYDFELGKEKQTKNVIIQESSLYFGLFKASKTPLTIKKMYSLPTIPHSFTGKHKIKKSRFQPIEVKMEKDEEIDRSTINPIIRARYLGEEPVNHTPSQPILENPVTKKEKRPSSAFDISALMENKFVSASLNNDVNTLEPVAQSETEHGTRDMREAAKMNMFGPLTRITTDWTPCAIMCKRFNVPEPLMDRPEQKNRKRTKNLIFENQKHTDDTVPLKPGCSTNFGDHEDMPNTSRNAGDIMEEQIPVIKSEQITLEEEKEVILNEEKGNINEDEKQLGQEVDQAPTDITEKIGIENKVDLFKAVFLSSSESEGDEDENEEETVKKTEEFKETILSDLIPKIRPLKQGILSNLNFQPVNHIKDIDQKAQTDVQSIVFIPRKDRNVSNNNAEEQLASYGPQLPSQVVIENSKKVSKTNTISLLDSDDEWVEKDDSKEKKSKHKKKNKKNKKKHKHSKKDRS